MNLADHTTLGVGGRALAWREAHTEDQLLEALRQARREGLPTLVLGGGSNLLVSDAGFPGLVVKVGLRGVRIDGELVTAAAGEPWADLVERVVGEGMAGLAALAGIPGTVGAAPVQNVGAYGVEVADHLVSVRLYDPVLDAVSEIPAASCGFAYRSSRLKRSPGAVVLDATFRLRPGGVEVPRYAELQRALGDEPPTPARVAEVVVNLRRKKSMILDPSDPESRSAGSFFTNPVVSAAQAGEVERLTGAPEMPRWPTPDGVKLAAAWLIERAGFPRGYTDGRVGLSRHHALALVNRGGATAREVHSLALRVQAAVQARFGVRLEPEVVCVGF